jgi:hypothetical protein
MFKVKEGLRLFDNQTTVRYPTGNYGSFEVAGGGKSGWEGYSIGGRVNFMHSGTEWGMYNDVNNQWAVRGWLAGSTELFYNGSQKIHTTSDGGFINDTLYLGATDSGDSHFYFGEDSSGWYGEHTYWDSGYAMYHYSRYAGTDSLIYSHDTRYTHKIKLARGLERTGHSTGYFIGSYNLSGANDAKTNPIYTIGDNYRPTDTSFGNMYGIGYAHNNIWGGGKSSGWGLYVNEAGRVFCTISSSGLWHEDIGAVWGSSNDGSGSGLDADLLDGKHASAFALAHSHPYLRSDIVDTLCDTKSSGTLMSRSGFSDFIGYNPSYGSYIGGGAGNAGHYIYSGGYISKGGVHTLWHSGNDGSGSGLDADLLDGLNSTDFARADYINSNYKDFTVNGDANTYYPVSISEGGHYGFHTYSISRGYSWTAPSTWNTASHKGGLTFTFQNSGDSAWGGNDKTIRVIQFAETYSTMVGGLALSTGGAAGGGVIVWLRGGGAQYRFHSPNGSKATATVHLTSVTASNGTVYSPRSYNSGTVNGEVNSRYPVRGTGSFYSGNNLVWHAGNDGSGTGLDADLLDGLHGSSYLRSTAKAADSNLLDGIDSGSFLRSDASDSYSGTLTHSSQVGLVPNDYGKGVFGVYSSTRYQHVWSMGTAYKTNTNGTSYGNMYGLTWTHTNVGTGTNQSISGLGHQLQLRMNGVLYCAFGSGIWTSGNITAYSDRAVKTNFEVIPNALDKVMQINGYTYDRTDYVEDPETGIMPDTRQAGVVAQEVEAILPEVVSGQEGNKAVAYGNMVALLIEAIKEQQGQIEDLKSEMKTLKDK